MDKGELIGVIISVTDYGIGIAKKDRENLFKPYYRASDVKNREMNPQSHGIGLSVCKKIAKSLGGDLILNKNTLMGC
jgi:signal transduction histidine kinase